MLEWYHLLIIATGGIALGFLIGFFASKKKKSKPNQAVSDSVYEKKGVRYSNNSNILNGNAVNVTTNEGDRILECGSECRVRVGNYVQPGHYTILSTSENISTFNVRIGGLVREYAHGQAISLADGEIISPVSNSIILR
ncbi:MAG: hypothetical protein LBF68_03390 [Christensenellaceae bacterium]|jgi:hypothetical protein|nr:hypothetical protein [Christensenellaceae bacterium]